MSQATNFIPNYDYSELLRENAIYHTKVRAGKSSYQSSDWKDLQSKLLQIELRISSSEIIAHAALLFPKIGPE